MSPAPLPACSRAGPHDPWMMTTPGHGPGGGPAGTARYPDVVPTLTSGTAQTLRQPGIQVPSVTV
jgi:hypothetical protein